MVADDMSLLNYPSRQLDISRYLLSYAKKAA